MSKYQHDAVSHAQAVLRDEELSIQSLIHEANRLANTDMHRAIALCQEAQSRALSFNFPVEHACALVQEAIYHFQLVQYDRSLQLALDALEEFNALEDDFGKAVSLKTIGCVYAAFSQPQKALEHFLSALSHLLPLSETHFLWNKRAELGIITTNIGACYQNLNDYEQALSYYLKAMEYLSDTGDAGRLASCVTNLGALHSALNNPDEAIMWLERAIEYGKQSNQTRSQLAALINLGEVYRKMGNSDKARDIFHEGLRVVEETGVQRHLEHLYIGLSELYEQLGDYKQALAYHKKYVEVSEQQFGKQMAEKIKALEIEFALKESKQNAQLAEQTEKIKQLEEMVTICAWSGKIKMGDKWVRVEEFLQKKFGFKVSHGITEKMAETLRQQYQVGKSL